MIKGHHSTGLRGLSRRRWIAGAVGALTLPAAGSALGRTGPIGVGLVIGNQAYSPEVGVLKNAVADAVLIGRTLQSAGFAVPPEAMLRDLNRDDLQGAVRGYARRLAAAGNEAVGFVYYAGHGAADANGDNFMIPVSVTDTSDDSVWDRSVQLKWLFEVLGAVDAPQIICLDACRNSLRLGPRTKGLPPAGGFGNIVQNSPHTAETNMFISYATWEGQTASDGRPGDPNGPYAATLAGRLRDGGRVIEIFEDVRLGVRAATDEVQEPMNLSRLRRESSKTSMPPLRTNPKGDPTPVAGGSHRPVAPRPVALVIACSLYTTPDGMNRLPNTLKDGGLIAGALRGSGFETLSVIDPDREAMAKALSDFVARLKGQAGQGLGALYFTGYAASTGNRNVMLPAGALPDSPNALQEAGLFLDEFVIEVLGASPKGVAIMIDGARLRLDGDAAVPTPPSWNRFIRGLELARPKTGIVVSYSTGPEMVIADASAPSAYAAALAVEMGRPIRRDFVDLFAEVRETVMARTKGREAPWVQAATRVPLYFRADLPAVS